MQDITCQAGMSALKKHKAYQKTDGEMLFRQKDQEGPL